MLGIPRSSTVAEVLNEHIWTISQANSDEVSNLHDLLRSLPNPPPHIPDEYVWEVNGSSTAGFSASKTWEALRDREPIKEWYKMVWFKGAVPKNAFHMWLTQINRLPTRQRLASWGITADTNCLLCTMHTETRDHIMLSCSYAVEIWTRIFARIGPNQGPFVSWNELLSWTKNCSTGAPTILRNIIVQSTCYNIWKQRNSALHNNHFICSAMTFHLIDKEIKSIISEQIQ